MRIALLALIAAGALLAQETPLTRLKREAVRTQTLPLEKVEFEPLHQALRDWLEWRLPYFENSVSNLDQVEAAMRAELKEADLTRAPEFDFETKPGYLDFDLVHFPELPHTLFVIAGISVPCGLDQVVYGYRYDPTGRTRVLQDHPKNSTIQWFARIEISEPDAQGRRLLLTSYRTVQCASAWMGMAYAVYRVDPGHPTADLLFQGDHPFWLSDYSPIFVLKPEELLIEFRDSSIDGGVHNRTNIERFNFTEGVRRLDPVAFQPQDFVEEWLVRPWSEMQSRSVATTKPWHDKLHKDSVLADYDRVVSCAEKQDRWLIGLDIENHRRTWFRVHDLGNYRYEMESVTETKPKGCPGEAPASEKHPYLSLEELKALP